MNKNEQTSKEKNKSTRHSQPHHPPVPATTPSKLDVKSIADFESPHVYASTRSILLGINPDLDLPKDMPGGKAAKFRACTTLANTVEELGYSEKVGYEAFLYPNVKDTRKLLMW